MRIKGFSKPKKELKALKIILFKATAWIRRAVTLPE